MYRIRNDQVDIPINAAIEIEIADQRHNIQLQGVIHLYQYLIFDTIFYFICYFKNESAITTTVFSQTNGIYKNCSDRINSFKAQE